jgi:polysaccharide deacetylase 2 family uncharacterized protein YibQ
MKIAGHDCAAFVLTNWQAAIAQHAKPEDNRPPAVQIVGAGMGLSVCGVDALEALQQAIDYALNGRGPAEF